MIFSFKIIKHFLDFKGRLYFLCLFLIGFFNIETRKLFFSFPQHLEFRNLFIIKFIRIITSNFFSLYVNWIPRIPPFSLSSLQFYANSFLFPVTQILNFQGLFLIFFFFFTVFCSSFDASIVTFRSTRRYHKNIKHTIWLLTFV